MGGHSLPKNVNVGYVNGTHLFKWFVLHLLNTKHSSKCFPPYRVFWSSPDPHLTQQGSWGSVSQSSVTLAIFRQEATLLVLVGGRCWKGTGKGKSKGRGVGWRKNPRGREWLRGQSPPSKVKVCFEGLRVKMRLSFALCFSLHCVQPSHFPDSFSFILNL